LCIEIQIGCTSVFTISLLFIYTTYFHNIFRSNTTINRLFLHVHYPQFFYCSSLHWPMFTFGGKMLLSLMVKLIGILKTHKLKLLKLLTIIKRTFVYYYCLLELLLSLFLHVHIYTNVITHVECLSDGLLILRYLNY
jgi:hypothetical protein